MSKLGFDPVNPGKSSQKCDETPKGIVPYRGKLMIRSGFDFVACVTNAHDAVINRFYRVNEGTAAITATYAA